MDQIHHIRQLYYEQGLSVTEVAKTVGCVTIHGVFGPFLYLRIPIATKRHFNRPRQLKHSAGHMPVPKVSGFSIQACSFISPPATSPTGMFFLF